MNKSEKDILLAKIGARIKQLRTERNITQSELASLVNKDQQSLSRIEVGGVNVSVYYLYEISNALNIDLKDLFDD